MSYHESAFHYPIVIILLSSSFLALQQFFKSLQPAVLLCFFFFLTNQSFEFHLKSKSMNSSTIIKYFITFRKKSSAQLGHVQCSIKSIKLFIFARSFLQGLYHGFQLHLLSNFHQILYSGNHLCRLKICPIICLHFCTTYLFS